ncbi:MAG: hypothetical protein MJ071_01255 [Oscillospiraceae bacterium]|nr:hypothetical protein [Oscillospiraceae bacterium]
MGLFDIFSKGGKYFGKAIEPKCEYCEHGNRTTEGNKVLCKKKGMVEITDHCPKFQYSPLKRIPVKQMQRVGWLNGDYEEKDFESIQAKKMQENAAKAAEKKAEPAPKSAAKKAESAPKPAEKKAEPAPKPAEKKAEPAPKPAEKKAEPAPKPVEKKAEPVKKAVSGLDSLVAAAEAAGEYQPEEAAAEPKQPEGTDMSALSSM